jgi:hypothetical protein
MDLEALLAARPSRREDLGAWYSRLLEAAERAGTPVPVLARRLGCSRETIYSWRRRMTKQAGETSRPAVGLVRVQVSDPTPEPDAGRLEVRTRTGRSVLVSTGFDPSTLAAVVAVLERC